VKSLLLLESVAVGSHFERFVDGLTALPDACAIWNRTAEFAYALDYSCCSLTIARKSASDLQLTFFMSDLPDEFSQAYRNDGLVGVDPFLQFSCNSLTAKKVATDDLACFKGASAENQAFLDQAAESGAVAEMGIPARTQQSEHFGGWLFSSRERQDALIFWTRTMVGKPTLPACWAMSSGSPLASAQWGRGCSASENVNACCGSGSDFAFR
jgi:hypothetical protein